MSRGTYMPGREADQIAFLQNFSTVVGPAADAYGVSSFMMEFTGDVAALVVLYNKARDPLTRTKVAVQNKDVALKDVKAKINKIVSVIQGTPTVTPGMLLAAGLTVRKTTRTPKPPPQGKPFIQLVKVDGRTATFELRQTKAKRGRPADVAGATVFLSPPAADGAAPRMSAGGWQFATNTTKTTFAHTFPPSETGDTYYVTAFWSNSRDESGPAAEPVRVNLPAGEAMPAIAAAAATAATASRRKAA